MSRHKRIYRRYDEWEEVDANMWGDVPTKAESLAAAVAFTGNAREYGAWMMRVVSEWPASCENALTDYSMNRRAWVGHAACAMAIGCPEYITREAWGMLTNEQRALANAAADRAILAWEARHGARDGVPEPVAQAVLFG